MLILPWNIGWKYQQTASSSFLDVDIYKNVKKTSLNEMASEALVHTAKSIINASQYLQCVLERK